MAHQFLLLKKTTYQKLRLLMESSNAFFRALRLRALYNHVSLL